NRIHKLNFISGVENDGTISRAYGNRVGTDRIAQSIASGKIDLSGVGWVRLKNYEIVLRKSDVETVMFLTGNGTIAGPSGRRSSQRVRKALKEANKALGAREAEEDEE
ncbi:MAG: hypothetical protein V1897_19865, partial [Pseudomonadota bacterium]